MVIRGANSSSIAGAPAQELFSEAMPPEEDSPNNLGPGIGLCKEEGDDKNVGTKISHKYIGLTSQYLL